VLVDRVADLARSSGKRPGAADAQTWRAGKAGRRPDPARADQYLKQPAGMLTKKL